jgi:hypothetical protein
MAFDALAEALLKAVGGFLVEVVFVGVFYWPGWVILRVLTFGRYPPRKAEPHSKEFVATFGSATILACLLVTVPGGGL